jgi:hypothetical protein
MEASPLISIAFLRRVAVVMVPITATTGRNSYADGHRPSG